jgi:hypothetical protein
MLAGLALAISLIGMTPASLGIPSDFWCDDFAAKVVGQPAQDGPTNFLFKQVEFEATPGGIVGINAPLPPDQSDPKYAFHVAIIERTTPDGGVDVVEGNGADRDHVTRNHYDSNRITKTYITPDAHQEYEHGLCLQLQEAKPWINWEC